MRAIFFNFHSNYQKKSSHNIFIIFSKSATKARSGEYLFLITLSKLFFQLPIEAIENRFSLFYCIKIFTYWILFTLITTKFLLKKTFEIFFLLKINLDKTNVFSRWIVNSIWRFAQLRIREKTHNKWLNERVGCGFICGFSFLFSFTFTLETAFVNQFWDGRLLDFPIFGTRSFRE